MEVFGLKIIEGLNQVYTNNIKPASHKDLSNVKTTTMPVKTDKIELSSLSKEMNRYIELAKSSEGDSSEKIARIKNEINNGTQYIIRITQKTYGKETIGNIYEKIKNLKGEKLINCEGKIALVADDNGINFISRQSYNNGVNSVVELIENVKPFDSGCITVALGGEYLGSAFVQLKPFYTGAHMAVLTPKEAKMTLLSKLFICTLIRFESKIKYCAFGRELDTHIDREFSIKLPVIKDGTPDWNWIDNYIKSLPYSDRI